jgi:hypothetical protein
MKRKFIVASVAALGLTLASPVGSAWADPPPGTLGPTKHHIAHGTCDIGHFLERVTEPAHFATGCAENYGNDVTVPAGFCVTSNSPFNTFPVFCDKPGPNN